MVTLGATPGATLPAAAEKAPTVELRAARQLPEPDVTPALRNRQTGQTGQAATAARTPGADRVPAWQSREVPAAAGRNVPPAAGTVPPSGGDGEPACASAAPSPERPSSPAHLPGGPVTAVAANPAAVKLAVDGEPAESPRPVQLAARPSGETATPAVAAPPTLAAADGEPASPDQPVRGAPGSAAEFPASAVGTSVAGSGSESPVPGPGQRAARPQDGRSAASPKKTQTAATASRRGTARPSGPEQGQAAQVPALAPSPAGMAAKSDAGAAGTPVPRTARAESVPPPPAAEKPAAAAPPQPAPAAVQPAIAAVQPAIAAAEPASGTAEPASGTAQHFTPSTRRRPEDPDLAVAAGETAVRAATPAPVWRPSADVDLTDFSVRPPARMPASAPSRRSSAAAVAEVLALSGQAPRTVDSIPQAEPSRQPVERAPGPWSNPQPGAAAEPEAPVTAEPQSLAATPAPAADAQVRVLDSSTADRHEVAFAVQMKATPAPEDSVQRESPARLPEAEAARRISLPAPPRDVPAPEPAAGSENRPTVPREADETPAHAGKERRPEAGPAERTEAPAGAADGKLLAHASPDAQVKAETAPGGTETAAAKPVRPLDAMESEAPPAAAKAPLVRDLKLEVTGGEQRVEIRVSERGGDVKMTVRTPDTELAGALRENLPTLSARLADSGFRSDAWHPAASATNQWRHAGESSGGGASPDANTPSRQQNRQAQDDAGQRRPKSPQEATPQKEKGKDFAWLMSTLR